MSANSFQSATRSPKVHRSGWKRLPILLLGLTLTWAGQANAQTPPQSSPQTPPQSSPQRTPQPAPQNSAPQNSTPQNRPPADAPPELLQILSQIDAAASAGRLREVMSFYSTNFTNSDGLTYTQMRDVLKELWQRYPNLRYSTQLNRWQREGNAIVIETTTTITTPNRPRAPQIPLSNQQPNSRQARSQQSGQSAPAEVERSFNLTATITSRQRLENQKIVRQEILTERSQLTSGENPPTLTVNLPEQVRVGQPFDFDAVVTEPLGERLLLGAAIEEPVQASGYLSTAPVELELLSAGGLFKVGQAPAVPGNRWISAVIVRDDGITTVTQRLQTTPNGAGARR
jgi:hypothetical protein